MRIPNLTMSDALVARLNTLNVQQTHFNDQLASGQRIKLASEDPEAAARILHLRSEKSNIQVYSKNGDRALGVAQATSASLMTFKSLSDRATELATLASDPTASAKDRAAYALEVNELMKSAIDAGNATFQGEYLFNGTDTAHKPFTDDGAATPALTSGPATPVTLSGVNITNGSNTFTVASATGLSVGQTISGQGIPIGTTIESISGTTITLSNNATQTNTGIALNAGNDGLAIKLSDSVMVSPFTTGAANAKLKTFINALASLRTALNSNTVSNIAAAKTSLLSSEDDLVGIIADNSALQTRMNSVQSQNTDRFNNMETLISRDADVDTAQTMVNLTRARTSYQAALEAGAQVMKLSLLDYLR